jgi:Spy/CpxP family protein refolding chaperone
MENNKNYWKTGVIVTLIFILGYLAGIATMVSLHYVRERRFARMRSPGETLTLLAEKLDLNQEQKTAVRNIVRRTREDLFQLREDARPQVRRLLRKARDEIEALLNEDQREQFDRLIEDRLERLMKGPRGGRPPRRDPRGFD